MPWKVEIVDDIEHHRSLVGGGENQGGVEVRFGGRTIADPRGGDLRVVLDRGRHGPTYSLYILGRQISRKREEAVLLRRIENRHLAAFQRIPLVGVDLAHHIAQRMAGGDQQSCLTIGRKIHVARQECLAKSAADRLFAHVLHIEGCFALPLRHQHARVEGA